MKFKAAITSRVPDSVKEALGSPEFAKSVIDRVAEKALGAQNTANRPAEYYMQAPDITINTGRLGIEVRVTGVSREGRTAAQFERAIETLHWSYASTVKNTLIEIGSEESIQVFVVIMLDGDIDLPACCGGGWGSVMEHFAVWVSTQGIVEGAPE